MFYNTWKLIDTAGKVPVQLNSNDCGVFVAMCVERLMKNSRLTYDQSNAALFRKKMALAILNAPLELGF
jgi:Ulp1 family protease